ncbi:Putative Isonitrile hydratase [Kitasatospora sp. MMS16-BH015]|uniref:DJ-1/PfpI family protein n=1 Tax=Kitasatospora sp. MMS16-BH015 TaxID=2018025 RepID=UPI000CA39831|nr:DJ-1/PfpI family protein [Kitasatospora sp. MMS16-BH015]AUG76676.1 Putative Isonitrile hydratase [Kitasatospora sp. MMS16-BH015]
MDIVIPLFDNFEPLDAIGPYEILAYVPGATVRFVTARPGLVQDVLGSLPVQVATSYAEVERCDVLLIPGGGSFLTMSADPEFLDWVRRMHTGTRFTTSVCTGSLVLGAAGLLTGLTATTHWAAVADLEAHGATYSAERVVRQGRIITSAGVSSGIDMAVRLAALLTDEVTAQAIQLYTEYDPQPPFDTGSLAKAPAEVVERARSLR